MVLNHAASPAAELFQGRIRSVIAWLERFPLSILQFIFRFSVAAVFWEAGQTKLASWQTTIVLFRDEYRLPLLPPELAAYLATTVELTCPVLLVLGIASRLATLPLLAQTLVIEVCVYPEDWMEHLIWASMLLFILTRGPGVFSLDGWLAPRLFGYPRATR